MLPSKPGSPKCSVSFRYIHQITTRLDPITTFILYSHQNLGFSTVLFTSDFFIKTLYKPRQNTHFNIILPSNLGYPKGSVYFKLYHQTPVLALTNFPPLILYSHQPLGPLSVLFPSDFFIKTLFTPRPNRHFNNILPSNSVPLSVLFHSDFFIKTLYTSRPNPHFNIILPSTPGIPKCSLSFRFLLQTLYTPRPNRYFNNILPSNSGPPKCYLSFRFLHQNTLHT